jgi:subtilisin family serine protease
MYKQLSILSIAVLAFSVSPINVNTELDSPIGKSITELGRPDPSKTLLISLDSDSDASDIADELFEIDEEKDLFKNPVEEFNIKSQEFKLFSANQKNSNVANDLPLELNSKDDLNEAIAEISQIEEVIDVRLMPKVYIDQYIPNDPLYAGDQWQLNDASNGINAESAWESIGEKIATSFTACEDHIGEDKNCGGDKDVKVAVLDSGFDVAALPGVRVDTANAAKFYWDNPSDGSCGTPAGGANANWQPGPYANSNFKVNVVPNLNVICMAVGSDTISETIDDYQACDFELTNFCQTLYDLKPDNAGHGTAVASVIAMEDDANNGIGVASNITILPIAMQTGWERFSFNGNDIPLAVEYAVDQGADVINMSLGSTGSWSDLENAINYAKANGVVVVAASGNNALDPDCLNCPNYPAYYDSVISVGAVDQDSDRSSYSTYNSRVDVVAPVDGTTNNDVLTLCGVTDYGSCNGNNLGDVDYAIGTSFAAPQAAAAAGLLVSLYENGELPSKDPAFIEGVLRASADDLGPSGKDNEFGYGLLNIEDAIYAFPDVAKISTFGSFIYDLRKDGVVGGYSDGNFRPENNVDRAAMAKFIYNGFNFTPNTGCGDFSDVPNTSGFYVYITTLKCEGIIGGFADGSFKPSGKVDRGASMKFTINALRQKAANPSDFDYNPGISNPFSDLSSSHPFYEFIVVGVDQGIIGGYSNGTFQTSNTLTRGAMSKIISNARGEL